MIVSGKLDRILADKHSSIVSFAIPSYQAKYLDELTSDDTYKIEVKKVRSKRSDQQNNFMWATIGKIASVEGMDPDDVYCQLITMARIGTAFLTTTPELAKEIKEKYYRQMVEREWLTTKRGVRVCTYEVYPGTSKFSVAEMSEFIDRMLDYAARVGIDTREFER